MKSTFLRLPDEKRKKIIKACIDEFGARGYEHSSTDRIIRRAGISKGGLYEYISSKKELFLYVVEYSYRKLYDYLRHQLKEQGKGLPEDILMRLRLIASLAVDFYMSHPPFIALISKTQQLSDPSLVDEVEACFRTEFLDIFGDCHSDNLAFPRERVLELLSWLLLRTRNEFLINLERKEDSETVRRRYLENWEFYISVLGRGIYAPAALRS